jgi:hypothetical protein
MLVNRGVTVMGPPFKKKLEEFVDQPRFLDFKLSPCSEFCMLSSG